VKIQAESVRTTADGQGPKKNAVRASHPNRIHKREFRFCHFLRFVPPLQIRFAASLLFGFRNR